jgi:hypothetical protein
MYPRIAPQMELAARQALAGFTALATAFEKAVFPAMMEFSGFMLKLQNNRRIRRQRRLGNFAAAAWYRKQRILRCDRKIAVMRNSEE